MPARIDLTGQRFGRLVVLKQTSYKKYNRTAWECMCDCGNNKIVTGHDLMSGNTKSCHCYRRELTAKLKKGKSVLRCLPKGIPAFNKLYRTYKNSAKWRGYIFKLSSKIFKKITQQRCYYCGVKPSQKSRLRGCDGTYMFNGIDRVDNSKGYIEGNIVACCKWCNIMKRDSTQEDFLEHVKKIYKHNYERGI